MSKPTQPHKQIVKCFGFILLFVFISLGTIGGCSDNNGGGQNNTQALTENDFAENSALRGDPARGVLVTELEHPDSEAKENDTAGVGVDRIPLSYPETVEQTFCWEDDDPEAMHLMELLDSEENVVMTVEANGDCVDEIIQAGEYVMSFNHDGRMDRAFAIFSEPTSSQAANTNGFIDKLKTVAVNVLDGITNIATEDANAQSVQENILRLLVTNSCVGCNLEGANLSDLDLRGANLTNANLTEATMNFTDLEEARLIGANLTRVTAIEADFDEVNAENADFTSANMFLSEMETANLRGANFMDADLMFTALLESDFTDANLRAFLGGADFRFSNLTDADLRDAMLQRANLQFTILSGADFDGATWCNFCKCEPPSIGECTGCPPAQQVCTGL